MWKLTNPKGEWILAVVVAILLVRYSWTLHEYVELALDVPAGDAPGGDAPFWFLRQHVVDGVCAEVGMLLALLLAALTWKRYPRYSSTALWMGCLWSVPSVVDALIICCRSSNLMDPRRAATDWKTFDQWLDDPLRRVSFYASLAAIVALAFALRRRSGWTQLPGSDQATRACSGEATLSG